MATSAAATAASANVCTNPLSSSTTVNITVECIWWNTSKTLQLSLTLPSHHTTSDDDGKEHNKVDHNNDDDEDFRKYSMCSLLLQLGQLFDIQPPPCAPSLRLSSIFNKLLECWSLQRKSHAAATAAAAASQSTYCKKKIRNLSDIKDGDELLFSCDDYFKKIPRHDAEKNDNNIAENKNAADSGSGEKELDILQLLPKKYNLVTVCMIEVDGDNNDDDTNGRRIGKKVQKKDIECIELLSSSSSSDDEVEDVTELYRKSRPPPEIIEVEDASDSSSREDEHHDERKKSRSHNNCNNIWGNHSIGVDNLFGSGSDHSSDNDEDDDDDSFIEDVTDEMLAKKQEEQQKLIDEAELLETDSEDDTKKKRRRKRRSTNQQGRKKRKIHVSPLEVVIEDKDVPDCPGASCEEENDNDNQGKEGGTGDDDNNGDVDLSIKQRIIKLLNTGLHCESNENEAKNAMKLARRLLDRYNLDQAILLKERGDGSLNDFSTTNDKDDDGLGIKGGIVTVNVLNRKKSAPLSTMPRWLEHLIAPVTTNFQVDAFVSFSRTAGQCAISFYGIKTNVQLAAYAFKIAAERIAFMAASYEIPRSSGSFRGKRKQSSASQTRTARLSYALGIVAGLHEDVKRGLQEEEEKRQEDLKRARNAAKTTGEVYEEDCRDEEKEEQEQQKVPAEETLHQLENENEARLALIDCNKKVANDVLKAQKINLSTRRKRSVISFNLSSYETGVVHSKEIDLNQKAIQS